MVSDQIQNSIEDIRRLIKWRENLRDNRNQELDELGTRLRNYLGGSFFAFNAWNPGVSDLHVLIHKTILEAEKTIAQERIETWRDLQDLFKELRTLQLEQSDNAGEAE